jgi:ligand-binding sensor domain-containing protein/signal transduction histidine kinase
MARVFPVTAEACGFRVLRFRFARLTPAPVLRFHAKSKGAAGRISRNAPVPRVWARVRSAAQRFLRAVETELLAPTVFYSVCAASLLFGGAPAGLAVEPSTPLAGYARQAWVMENGLPQNTVQALLQTRQGYVWVGTEAGLARFDGIGFQVFDHNSTPSLPSSDIRCLLQTRDGALWVGTSEGLARWKDGVVTAFTTRNGLPGNVIRALVQTGDGVLWVWTDLGLARLSGERFVAGDDGLPGAAITAVLPDGHGGMRVETAQWTAVYKNGHWSSVAAFAGLLRDGISYLAALPGGESVIGSKSAVEVIRGSGGVARAKDPVVRLRAGEELPGNRIQALLADREGSLWIGTNEGLARWVGGKLQRLPITDPLATASVLSLMEDREGDVWVGTETDGLHILRDQRFQTFDAREGLSSEAITTVVEDSAGTLWVGTQEDGLNALRHDGSWIAPEGVIGAGGAPGGGAVRTYTVNDGLVSDVILSLAAAPNGDLWVGTPDGLNRIHRGGIDTFTSADGLPDDFIRSLLVDSDGSLWIGTRRGLVHWTDPAMGLGGPRSHEQMRIYTQANGLGSDLVGAMTRDSNGDLWVATLAGLSRLHDGTISNYTTANGLSSDVVTALLPRADGALLIGTQDHGLDLWNGRKFSAVVNNGLTQTTIHAILDDGRGHLWFATGDGIARCDCNGTGGTGPLPGCSHWMEFGTADGLRSREMATNSHPSAWRSRDGHLWFATPKGLVEVDPAHFPVNELPPPVVLERFAVDDVNQPLRGASPWLKIPAGHVHFEFDYAGLSFIAPQKARYRYILEGFDHGWTEAGARRTAYYTNIPPGRYTFRVQAANNDGLWNTTGAALSFELRPLFYQTVWFYALLLAAMAGGVVLLLRLRLRRAEHEFGAVLGERSRIAREIHDTLAQGYVGISAQLEVLAELLRLRKVDGAAKQLDLTRSYVREGLADARQSIWALRTQDSGETTLPVRLRRIVEAAEGSGLESRFSVFGAYRPLPAETERELLRVAQEAVHNVKKHAGASQLSVQLEYGPATIALEVRDNGRGGAVDQKPESLRGHFGLTGMRERAAAMGGTLEVSGGPGEGTTVRLRAAAPGIAREQTREPR